MGWAEPRDIDDSVYTWPWPQPVLFTRPDGHWDTSHPTGFRCLLCGYMNALSQVRDQTPSWMTSRQIRHREEHQCAGAWIGTGVIRRKLSVVMNGASGNEPWATPEILRSWVPIFDSGLPAIPWSVYTEREIRAPGGNIEHEDHARIVVEPWFLALLRGGFHERDICRQAVAWFAAEPSRQEAARALSQIGRGPFELLTRSNWRPV